MTRAGLAASARPLRLAFAYVVPALLLAWFAGGQMALGRIDAALAVPLLMPGALFLARLVRDDEPRARWTAFVFAAGGLLFAQLLLHLLLGDRLGAVSLLLTALAGCCALWLASLAVAAMRRWRRRLRWPALLLLVLLYYAAGQGVLGLGYAAGAADRKPGLAILTGLPLRWQGGGDDLAAMLAAGPSDAPALAALEGRFAVRLVDSLADVHPDEALLVAHPRALAPADLVRLDERARRGGPAGLPADPPSTRPPPHPLGDPRNPPVTSLLTPLLDHWGITLAAPDPGREGEAPLFTGPGGRKLLLHSAGRFTRLPDGCSAYGDGRAARCRFSSGPHMVWLVGDADMLHDSLWRSPVAAAPWLRRSDNIVWLADVLGGREAAPLLQPVWIG